MCFDDDNDSFNNDDDRQKNDELIEMYRFMLYFHHKFSMSHIARCNVNAKLHNELTDEYFSDLKKVKRVEITCFLGP